MPILQLATGNHPSQSIKQIPVFWNLNDIFNGVVFVRSIELASVPSDFSRSSDLNSEKSNEQHYSLALARVLQHLLYRHPFGGICFDDLTVVSDDQAFVDKINERSMDGQILGTCFLATHRLKAEYSIQAAHAEKKNARDLLSREIIVASEHFMPIQKAINQHSENSLSLCYLTPRSVAQFAELVDMDFGPSALNEMLADLEDMTLLTENGRYAVYHFGSEDLAIMVLKKSPRNAVIECVIALEDVILSMQRRAA